MKNELYMLNNVIFTCTCPVDISIAQNSQKYYFQFDGTNEQDEKNYFKWLTYCNCRHERSLPGLYCCFWKAFFGGKLHTHLCLPGNCSESLCSWEGRLSWIPLLLRREALLNPFALEKGGSPESLCSWEGRLSWIPLLLRREALLNPFALEKGGSPESLCSWEGRLSWIPLLLRREALLDGFLCCVFVVVVVMRSFCKPGDM